MRADRVHSSLRGAVGAARVRLALDYRHTWARYRLAEAAKGGRLPARLARVRLAAPPSSTRCRAGGGVRYLRRQPDLVLITPLIDLILPTGCRGPSDSASAQLSVFSWDT
jgi:hypothetical protein